MTRGEFDTMQATMAPTVPPPDDEHTTQRMEAELAEITRHLAHGLTTPLWAFESFIKMFLERHGENLSPDAMWYIERLQATHRQMENLVKGVDALAAISRHNASCNKLNVSSLVSEAVKEQSADCPKRRVEAFVEPDLHATVDASLMSTAMRHLVANAIKFTQHCETTVVEFGLHDSHDVPAGFQVFFLRDNGVGFDPSLKYKLFAPFQRLHAEPEFEGLGMGLACARRAIHRQGGEIRVESTPSRGATVYMMLPQ